MSQRVSRPLSRIRWVGARKREEKVQAWAQPPHLDLSIELGLLWGPHVGFPFPLPESPPPSHSYHPKGPSGADGNSSSGACPESWNPPLGPALAGGGLWPVLLPSSFLVASSCIFRVLWTLRTNFCLFVLTNLTSLPWCLAWCWEEGGH